LYTNFHQIRQVGAAINAEQCVLKLSKFTCCVYTHYLVMLRLDRIRTKYCNFTELSAETHSRCKTKTI